MANVGDLLYHWRYGVLKVEKVDAVYIYTKIIDKEGIVEGENGWERNLKESEKVFQVSALGQWIHNNEDDAICGNNNLQTIPQGQNPLAMKFPINGNAFHKSFQSTIQKYSNDLKKIADIKIKIEEIKSENNSNKDICEKTVDKIFEKDTVIRIKELVNECPSDNDLKRKYKNEEEFNVKINENKTYLRVLNCILENISKNDFILDDCESYIKEHGKDDFTNDASYKAFTILVEEKIKLVKSILKTDADEIKSLLEKIKKIKSSKKLEDIVNSQNVNAVDKNLLSEIANCLDEELKIEIAEHEKELLKLKKRAAVINKLSDSNYVTFSK